MGGVLGSHGVTGKPRSLYSGVCVMLRKETSGDLLRLKHEKGGRLLQAKELYTPRKRIDRNRFGEGGHS
jgi:hypothetical protein